MSSGLFGSSNPFRPLPFCGVYYILPGSVVKQYLPQVKVKAHATILATTSRTVLTQTFVNPSSNESIPEALYTFPLYDGVSVVSFECHIGKRIIRGTVKEKEKARAVYKEAVERGEVAGLLEQHANASDVYSTKVANIPAKETVVVKIEYLGELKNDSNVDGIRYTIPTAIAPRYGRENTASANFSREVNTDEGMNITVDVVMAEGTSVKSVQSPSHPIAISIGNTSTAPNEAAVMHKASATLSLGSTELEKDFVLLVLAQETGVPKALLETHPSMPNQRALLATLVPKFSLPQEKPEIVFVADRSGSMQYKIPTLVRALELFVKSLPLGVRFNICSFGSHYSLLWPKSKAYSQQALDEAMQHIATFAADYGGTQILEPVEAVVKNRFVDIPLEIMLLTDGQIWNQQELFDYLTEQVKISQNQIRAFTLGIGDSVSHSLTEGIARAGNGFSQAVMEDEQMSKKVIRMLKGGLTPHISDYTLEVKYSGASDASDDFEFVDKVTDCLDECVINTPDESNSSTIGGEAEKKPISLFDQNADPDEEDTPMPDATGEDRYKHLPDVNPPKLLQAPHNIPPLFPFIRSSVYLLMSPETAEKHPVSVVLRGSSRHGPLELEIPVSALSEPGETIHQLAAKKAILDLEEGHGWLTDAKTADGVSLKERYPSRFDEMVEREAVRLGVQYQVGGKWCSFVAVENEKEVSLTEKSQESAIEESGVDSSRPYNTRGRGMVHRKTARARHQVMAPAPPPPAPATKTLADLFSRRSMAPSGTSLFQQQQPMQQSAANFGSTSRFPVAHGIMPAMAMPLSEDSPPSSPKERNRVGMGFVGSGPPQAPPPMFAGKAKKRSAPSGSGLFSMARKTAIPGVQPGSSSQPDQDQGADMAPKEKTDADRLYEIVGLQSFEGFWELIEETMAAVGLTVELAIKEYARAGTQSEYAWATVLVIVYLRRELRSEEDAWELIVDKAVNWLDDEVDEATKERLFEKAHEVFDKQ